MRRLLLLFALTGSAPAHAQITLPVDRTIASLASADARVRRGAAERLALEGTHDQLAEPLRVALEHEAVPEALSAMIGALARRADESDLAALEAVWDRGSAVDRRHIVMALDAIETDAVLPLLRAHLGSEGVSSRACAALVRTPQRVAWLAGTLEDAAVRDRVVSCLASAPTSEVRDAALVRAGLALEPTSAREVLAGLARAQTSSEAAIALAIGALDRAEAGLQPAALALLARHAPGRLTIERWRSWLDGGDDREASAVRALLVLAPALADEAMARMRARDGASARHALTVLLDRDDPRDATRIAAFVETDATRQAALDRLAAIDGGADVLGALPPAADVDLALALAGPTGTARDALLARTSSIAIRALTHAAAARECADAGGLAAAVCLALSPDGASFAVDRLETERDEAIVGWLALAAHGSAIDSASLSALLDDETTRAAAIALVPASLARATPRDRRAWISRLVVLTRDGDEVVRAEATRVLGAAHPASMLRALEDPSPQVRLVAARALGASSDPRVVGRRHVEEDPRVLAALRGEAIMLASAPLHVYVVEHDASRPGTARVTIFLADGRSLRLSPHDGTIVLLGVPDAPAIVQLGSASRH